MTKSKAKKINRDRRWYGMKSLKVGQKVCWMAKQDKNGWALGLAFNDRTLWLRNLRIPTEAEVKRVVKGSTVFIHVKETK